MVKSIFKMRSLFFHVSGEHDTLPYAEIRAILDAEGFSYEDVEILPQLLCLKSNVHCIPSVSRRASFLKACGIEIFRCRAEESEIIRRAEKEESYEKYMLDGQTFSVRIKKADTRLTVNVGKIESEIGRVILEKTVNGKVRLNNPDKSFFGVLTGNRLLFGIKLGEASSEEYILRKPRRRPFFHPSVMTPKLARCMANLARINSSSLVLDPFCGTGSILLEAGLIGCEVIGSDINPKMVRGSFQNLEYFKVYADNFLVADAKYLPFHQIDYIVTDPPYGMASSTFKRSTKTIVSEFLSSAADVLKEGGYVSISLPTSVKIKEICETLNYKVVEEHLVREHKSLTREIVVLQKLG